MKSLKDDVNPSLSSLDLAEIIKPIQKPVKDDVKPSLSSVDLAEIVKPIPKPKKEAALSSKLRLS